MSSANGQVVVRPRGERARSEPTHGRLRQGSGRSHASRGGGSQPTKRLARARVGESEGRSPSMKNGSRMSTQHFLPHLSPVQWALAAVGGARHRHLEIRARGDEPRAGSDLRVSVRRARINRRGAADAARGRHLRRAHLSSARAMGVHPPHAAASLPWA